MRNKELIDKGTYCLIIKINKDIHVKIGAKGILSFNEGYYVYIGSALNTLSKRIKRHLSDDKKKHWHIDYLLLNKNTKVSQVIYTYSTKKIECEISTKIKESAMNYIESFGCSDCECKSHLYYFNEFCDAEKTCIEAFEKQKYEPRTWFKNDYSTKE
ncbi:MAG: GIY-YIG nuclease family protein [Methanosphaera stadtmanae]|nr:GIY-YIG nuclease family protein [Methanosphaera stadtmanae]